MGTIGTAAAVRDSAMSVSALSPGRDKVVHPIVRLDYFVRIPASLVVLLVMGSIFLNALKSGFLWGLLVFYGLLWPHVALLVARRLRDSKAAELRNLIFDSYMIGFFAAISSFSLFPSVAFLTSINSANMSVGGLRFSLKGLGATLAGAATSIAIFGFHLNPDSSPLTTGFSILAIVSFTTIFGLHSHNQTRSVTTRGRSSSRRKTRSNGRSSRSISPEPPRRTSAGPPSRHAAWPRTPRTRRSPRTARRARSSRT